MSNRDPNVDRPSVASNRWLLLQRLHSMPVVFAAWAAGGLVGGGTALIYAASGTIGSEIYAWAVGLPAPRLLVGIGGVLLLCAVTGILIRHPVGLALYSASVLYLFAVVPFAVMWVRQHARVDMMLIHLLFTAALSAYGWRNRGWFKKTPLDSG